MATSRDGSHCLSKLQQKLVKRRSHPSFKENQHLNLTRHGLKKEGRGMWRLGKQLIDVHIVLLEHTLVILQRKDGKLVLGSKLSEQNPVLKLQNMTVQLDGMDSRGFVVHTKHQLYELIAANDSELKSWFEQIRNAVEVVKEEEHQYQALQKVSRDARGLHLKALDGMRQSAKVNRQSHLLWSELEEHLSVLLDVEPHGIQNSCFSRRLLSVTDTQNITGDTPREKNTKLLQILLSKGANPADVKAAICEGLRNSRQYCPLCPPETRLQPVSEEQIDELDRLRESLTDNMDELPVLDSLIQAGIVDRYIQESITAKPTRRQRVDRLLSFISRTHSQACDQFMQILQERNSWIFE